MRAVAIATASLVLALACESASVDRSAAGPVTPGRASGSDEAFARLWAQTFSLPVPVLIDTQFQTGAYFQASVMPANLFVDRQGVVQVGGLGLSGQCIEVQRQLHQHPLAEVADRRDEDGPARQAGVAHDLRDHVLAARVDAQRQLRGVHLQRRAVVGTGLQGTGHFCHHVGLAEPLVRRAIGERRTLAAAAVRAVAGGAVVGEDRRAGRGRRPGRGGRTTVIGRTGRTGGDDPGRHQRDRQPTDGAQHGGGP